MLEEQGWKVELTRPNKYGPEDFFSLWDIIAVKRGKTRWVQVKSNRLPPPAYRKQMARFEGAGTKELWIFYDNNPKQPRIIHL